MMASPWKALADLMYVRALTWPSITNITEDLRIEPEDFLNSDLDVLKFLSEEYPNGRTRNCLKRYYKELKS